jgi:hypothetical protein
MVVAVQKQQATQPIHQSTCQVLQKNEIFGQQILQCYNAFLEAQKTSYNKGPAFIDSFLSQDISLILLTLLFTQKTDSVLYAKACLDALYYQPKAQEYTALAQTLPLLIQTFCASDGKLTFKENTLKSVIGYGLFNGLPENLHANLHKIWHFAPNINAIKSPQWFSVWNSVLLHMQRQFAQEKKENPCTLEQAREHQYNKDLYALYAMGKNQEFEKAAQLVLHYKNDPFFKKVFNFYYYQSPEFKEQYQKNGVKPESPLEKLEKIQKNRDAAHIATQCDAKPYTKEYPLTPQTQHYLQQALLKPQPFQSCHGTHEQQQAHTEITKINKKAAELDEKNNNNPEVKKITREIPKFTNLAREYNEHGFIDQAYSVLDFCWALLDYACSLATGFGKGVVQGFGNYITYALENPLELLMRPLLGNVLCAIRLARLTGQLLNISFIGLKSLAGSQEAIDQWETICHNMACIKNALLTKFNEMSLEQYAQKTTALATQFMLDFKCAHVLANVYQDALTNAEILVKTEPSALLITTPAASASVILAGNGNQVLEQLIYYSSNSIGSSVEQTLHEQLQDIMPSHETIYYVARNEHMPRLGASRAEIIAQTQSGPAQFIGNGLLRVLKNAWLNGMEASDGKTTWHIMRCEKAIGAIDGHTTKYLKIKKVGNVLHGQPITYAEFLILKKGFYNV